MKKNLDSSSVVIAVSSFDLASVSGGQGGAELVGRPLPNQPPPPPPAAQPNLTCPPGTSPNWLRVTGEVDVNGSVIRGRVNGTVENFWCSPV